MPPSDYKNYKTILNLCNQKIERKRLTTKKLWIGEEKVIMPEKKPQVTGSNTKNLVFFWLDWTSHHKKVTEVEGFPSYDFMSKIVETNQTQFMLSLACSINVKSLG